MTLVLEIKHSKCVVSCIILPRARGKMIQYTGQNDTVRLSHLRFKYSRRSTEITINAIKQFLMLYIATEIWLNTNSFLNFLSHICYHSCFMFCHGAKWYSWPPIFNILKNKMVLFWHSSIISFSCEKNRQFQKNILKMVWNKVKLDYFRLYHFAPTTLYHFAPVTSCLLFSLQFKNTTNHNSSDYLETYQYLYSSIYTIQLKYTSTTFFTFIK